MPTPSSVAARICASAPGMAMARTESRSFREKCKPTPNISRMTPISASSVASCASPTKPGVNGPMTTPAIRYPTSGDSFRRVAIMPKTKARPRPMVKSEISGVPWGIVRWCPSIGVRPMCELG